MDGRNPFDGFDFNDHNILDQQIHPIAEVQLNPAVNDWKPNLQARPNPSPLEFVL